MTKEKNVAPPVKLTSVEFAELKDFAGGLCTTKQLVLIDN